MRIASRDHDAARRQKIHVRRFAFDSQHKLCEHAVDIGRVVLGLDPVKSLLRKKCHLPRIMGFHRHAEVDIPDYAHTVVCTEEICGDA